MALAVTIGSRWATRHMPVPSSTVLVAPAAIDSATRGSSVRLYSSASSASPVGGGVLRLIGMCVCSGTYNEWNPRSSTARANSTGPIVRSVMNIVTPNLTVSWLLRCAILGFAASARSVGYALVSPICEGRIVIVTGAGRGIGREHALAFAA